jgi:RNA polymerase sigma-70 factor (ECF subfamily)
MKRLGAEHSGSGKSAAYDALRPFLSREPDPGEYATVANRLNIAPGTLAVQVHRLRDRYRLLVRAAVADTVQSPLEVDAEMRHLLESLGPS